MSHLRIFAVTIAAVALLTGCAGGENVTVDELPMVDPLPQPTDDAVLTILGARHPNVGDEVVIDLAGIESLGTTTVTLHEPFVNEELEMTGVPVDTILAAAGVDPDDVLVWTALDDYQVHFNRRDVAAEGALLATRIGGSPIDIADGGPIRVVFTDGEGFLGRDTNQWIWSLHLIEVE